MALVIKELIITTQIQENTSPETSPGKSGPPLKAADKTRIVEECVEEVLKILETREER